MADHGQLRLKFDPVGRKWWNKPLVLFKGRHIPAELAVLSMEVGSDECGAWLNSRGTKTGVVDLVPADTKAIGSYRTRRILLPAFVSKMLTHLYQMTGVRKGCPDLVIWDTQTATARLVEVKCPHWDKLTEEQEQFLRVAKLIGVPTSTVEWEFSAARPEIRQRLLGVDGNAL